MVFRDHSELAIVADCIHIYIYKVYSSACEQTRSTYNGLGGFREG